MTDLDENKTPEAIIAEAMVSAGAPLMHSRVEEAVAGALRKAGMLAEQSGQVCAWCPSPARGSAHHNDGKLHPSCGQVKHGQGWVPDYPVERIGAIEAERDAALAAIERVTAERDSAMARIAKAWELHEPFIWSFGHGPVQSCKWCADHGVSQEVASWPCPTVAALDGASEPEWEYRAKVIHPGWVGNHYIVFKHEPTRDELENPVLFNDSFSGVNELEGGKLTGLEYRTPASDWLPVEGESKP